MLIEKINSASFANGILRLQVATTNGRGEWIEAGTIEIPGVLVASVINQISVAANDISGQLTQINEGKTDVPEIEENGAENKTKKTKTKTKDKN